MRHDMTAATIDTLDDIATDVREGTTHRDDAHGLAEASLGRDLTDAEADALLARLPAPRDMSDAEERAAARADAMYDARRDA